MESQQSLEMWQIVDQHAVRLISRGVCQSTRSPGTSMSKPIIG